MATPVSVGPSASEAARTVAHQKAIVEEVCKMFRVNSAMLVAAPKDTPFWKKVAGFVSYMQQRDTKATFEIIARHIGDVPSSVEGHIEYISTRLKKEDAEIVDRLYKLNDLVIELISDDQIVWHPKPKPVAKRSEPTLTSVLERKQIVKETVARLGDVPFHALIEDVRLRAVVRARDVILLIFTRYLGMEPKAAGDELKRSPNDVDWALKRMRDPDPERLLLLTRSCEELDLDVHVIMSE